MKQKPFLITRIRLINFHNFVDETIDLPNGGHLFLLGDNGCGKTTILDAIHYVLTAGMSMEWNAAARVAGARREGRRTQGIVMRYNLERGVMNKKGGVTYAVLEVKGRHGAPLTIGIGLSASAMDERVQQWGIIRECPLSEIPLIIEDEGGRRPAGRLELKERLGRSRGFYKDAKSYRRELAVRLFADQENYREICRFLAMGKAYREIASHAADYHELFKSLLPEPKTEIFERIIEALRTLDESKSVLDDLERKLAYLKGLQTFVKKIAMNREAVIRYQWLSQHHRAKMAEADIEDLKQDINKARRDLEEIEQKRRLEMQQVIALQTRLDDLKTKDARGLVRQEKDERIKLDEKNSELNTKKKECQESRRQQQAMKKKYVREMQDLRQSAAKLHGQLGKTASNLPFSISGLLAELDTMHRGDDCAAMVSAFDAAATTAPAEEKRDAALREKTLLEQEQEQIAARENAAREHLETLRNQREARPDLPGLTECIREMRAKMLTPEPLYKGLEWRPGLDRGEKARIEEFIGENICATLLLGDNEFETGRAIAALFPGVRITCPGRGLEELPQWMHSTFDLQKSNPYALRCLAAEMVSDLGPLVAQVNGRNILSFRSHDRSLAGRLQGLIGEENRQQAMEEQIRAAEKQVKELGTQKNRLRRQLKAAIKAVELVDSFRTMLDSGIRLMRTRAEAVLKTERDLAGINDILSIQRQRQQELERETGILAERLDELGRLIKQEGLAGLEKKIARFTTRLKQKNDAVSILDIRRGEIQNGITGKEEKITVLTEKQKDTLTRQQNFEQQLKKILPDIDDLPHYILRTRKGFQFKTIESVEREKELCEKTIVENRSILKERLNDPEFGASFRFSYEEESNELYDFRSRRIEDIISLQGGEIAEQK
jgi:energy-coupling factor transporter ATP-binding protein EcfA2